MEDIKLLVKEDGGWDENECEPVVELSQAETLASVETVKR